MSRCILVESIVVATLPFPIPARMWDQVVFSGDYNFRLPLPSYRQYLTRTRTNACVCSNIRCARHVTFVVDDLLLIALLEVTCGVVQNLRSSSPRRCLGYSIQPLGSSFSTFDRASNIASCFILHLFASRSPAFFFACSLSLRRSSTSLLSLLLPPSSPSPQPLHHLCFLLWPCSSCDAPCSSRQRSAVCFWQIFQENRQPSRLTPSSRTWNGAHHVRSDGHSCVR